MSMRKKRIFVAVGYGNRLGKWWTSTKIYEYVEFPSVKNIMDAFADMKKNFHVFDKQGNEKEYELDAWEDISCPGCTAKSCLRRSETELKKQSPIFTDNVLTIWPRCKNVNVRISIHIKGIEMDKINKILGDPEAYYKLHEIKTLHTAFDIAYQIARGVNTEAASLMRLVALREEVKP